MENKENLVLLIYISSISFLTLREKNILLKNLDSSDGLAILSIDDISRLVGRICRTRSWNAREAYELAGHSALLTDALKIGVLKYDDAAYPALLRETADAPFLLFYRGNVKCLAERTVSVVGTRQITPQGKQAAFSFAYDAVNDGCTVVSGLACGIDGAAHNGAVEACFDAAERSGVKQYGKTAAVLPGGIDEVVPGIHRNLAEKILRTGGCIVSEYAPGVGAETWRFVQRNRIIAGLSPATVVIEAPPASGALITADFALDYGRELLFHEAAFGKQAAAVAENALSELKRKKMFGKSIKTPNTARKYIDEGAPVVHDYADYRRCLAEMPGRRSENIKHGQITLF